MERAMSTMSKRRAWQGPTILSYGFRPFFFLAGLWAALAMVAWIAMLTGHAPFPTRFDAFTWHAHEFVFGYVSAVIAGFLLTAVPNWTGNLPVVGWPLGGLAMLWLAGRIAVMFSTMVSPWLVGLVDLALGVALILFLGREIFTGRNWHNLPVLGLLTLLVTANGLFHWAAAVGHPVGDNIGLRLGLATEIMLITLIGGRIVPSFTRNWLAQRKAARLPAQLGRVDQITLVATGVALISFVAAPENLATGVLCTLAGSANMLRLSRWQGQQTGAEPLLWVLHLAYGFLALGFFTVAAGAIGLMPMAGALHIWLVGAIGLMTVAVMTRATRGHTGKQLTAPPSTAAIYVLIVLAVVARIAAALWPAAAGVVLDIAAGAWIAAFALFAVIYGPMLLRASITKRT